MTTYVQLPDGSWTEAPAPAGAYRGCDRQPCAFRAKVRVEYFREDYRQEDLCEVHFNEARRGSGARDDMSVVQNYGTR